MSKILVVRGWGFWARQALTLLFLLSPGTAAFAEFAEIRQAKVAGQFYPADQVELTQLVSQLLERQPAPTAGQKPRILIVPHAGYPYSGSVAARAFRQVRGQRYDAVVVVGFTHRGSFNGSSVDKAEAYHTPLGSIAVSHEAIERLNASGGLTYNREAHESGEHSLEVELPFIQVALPEHKIVPILMGNASFEQAEQLANTLAALAQQSDYLFVFSTDLSHYHPYEEAKRIDERAISAILFETPQAVHRLFSQGAFEACGRGPILTSLLLAAKLGYPTRQLLQYANSGDTTGDQTRVVGYGAIAMYDRPQATTGGLSQEAGQALVRAARTMLAQRLGERAPSEQHALMQTITEELSRHQELSKASGLFVTLRKHGQLRGCIGRIRTEEPLAQIIGTVALEAALHDPRFAPVTAGELSELDVEVSVLTPPQRISYPQEIVAGRDGVILEYQGHSGIFLPQVWKETGWTRVEFLRELASQKAGLSPDAWQSATLSTFQDQVFTDESHVP